MKRIPRFRMKRRAHRAVGVRRPRGAVIAQVAVSTSVIVGFAALTVDVGHMYNTRAQLQRTADASAMAAAAALSDWSTGDPRQVAVPTAQAFATYNTVLGESVTLDVTETQAGTYEGDVIFGYASMGDTGDYDIDWDESDPLKINAVRVTVRRTEDAPSGAVPLYFANVFGISETNIAARATAIMTPRDIVFVLDLSGSKNDDSSLRSFKNPDLDEVGNKPVYESLYDEETALADQTDSLGFHSHLNIVDNGDGTSTITVDLTSDADEGTSALSHVTFGLPTDATIVSSEDTTGYSSPELGTDPTTGLYGLKFDAIGDGLGEDGVEETESFTFTLSNDDLEAMTLGVGTKAGKATDTSVEYNLSGKVTLGNMNDWGTEVTDANWDFVNDPGMVKLGKNDNWNLTAEQISEALVDRGYDAYTSEQAAVINEPLDGDGYETWDEYEERVKLALGINFWDDVDGDLEIDAGEVGELIPYPDQDANTETLSKKVGGDWDSFIQYSSGRYYTASMRYYYPDSGYYGDNDLRYRYGLKTWVDFLQDRVNYHKSEGLGGAPTQPMGAVADASKELLNLIDGIESQDFVGMASYATSAYGPSDKPDHMSWLTDDLSSLNNKIDKLYPGIWTSSTNIADGIEKGREVLFNSSEARNNAKKVMILLTDGIANQSRSGSSLSPADDAIEAATEAAENYNPTFLLPIQIHTVSVGANADKDLMEEIATIGHGNSFHAEGTIEEYEDQLKSIFKELGTKRPVILIE